MDRYMDHSTMPSSAQKKSSRFDEVVADIVARLVDGGERPTVRTIARLIPGAGNTKISESLRRFRRRTLARIAGLVGDVAPSVEEPSEHRLAAAASPTPSGLLSLDVGGAILRVPLDSLAEAVGDRRNVHQAAPSEGGGAVIFLTTSMPVAVRVSDAELAFLAGHAAVLSSRKEGP